MSAGESARICRRIFSTTGSMTTGDLMSSSQAPLVGKSCVDPTGPSVFRCRVAGSNHRVASTSYAAVCIREKRNPAPRPSTPHASTSHLYRCTAPRYRAKEKPSSAN